MTLTIRLLGPPRLERDGQVEPAPRGRKAWALLAYLLLAPRPPSRQRLVSLLFPDADDPFGALRWNLAELRRALGQSASIDGDPVDVRLTRDVVVDVRVATGDVSTGGTADGPCGELLEGLVFRSSPTFEMWLLGERRRVAAAVGTALYHRALTALAEARPGEAVGLASRAVELEALNSDYQAVLIRSLASAGDGRGARAQVARCVDVFRRELGSEPPALVREAAEIPAGRDGASAKSGPAAARSYLDAGRAAVAAGAVDRGLDQLRRALRAAEVSVDSRLRAEALLALGGAMVHATHAPDAVGAEVLHRAVVAAEELGDQRLVATACRELGLLTVLLGQRQLASDWLDRAVRLTDDEAELAAVCGVRGMSLSDAADYPAALAMFERSVRHAMAVGSVRQAAWSLSLIGRIHLLCGDLAQADTALNESLSLIRAERWVALRPWPESLLAESLLEQGDIDGAAELFNHAAVLADEVADACWIAAANRGLARVASVWGRHVDAWRHTETAVGQRAVSVWIRAFVLDAACAIALDQERPDAQRFVDELAAMAARAGMREFTVRAHAHAARLGSPDAAATARWLAAGIDNPALVALANTATRRSAGRPDLADQSD
jgi:DNA-binding SARP family transcriptional activator